MALDQTNREEYRAPAWVTEAIPPPAGSAFHALVKPPNGVEPRIAHVIPIPEGHLGRQRLYAVFGLAAWGVLRGMMALAAGDGTGEAVDLGLPYGVWMMSFTFQDEFPFLSGWARKASVRKKLLNELRDLVLLGSHEEQQFALRVLRRIGQTKPNPESPDHPYFLAYRKEARAVLSELRRIERQKKAREREQSLYEFVRHQDPDTLASWLKELYKPAAIVAQVHHRLRRFMNAHESFAAFLQDAQGNDRDRLIPAHRMKKIFDHFKSKYDASRRVQPAA